MESKELLLPLIHEHPMVPYNDFRKGNCCGLFEDISDGYYCKECDVFIHKKCGESSKYIKHPDHHPDHPLKLQRDSGYSCRVCGFCLDLMYHCKMCPFTIDLKCVKNPPQKVTNVSETHHHKLILLNERINFDCAAKCEKNGDGFPYKCHECNLYFHMDCVLPPLEENPLQVNHSYHSLHPLKLFRGQPPKYSDGKCRLCEREIGDGMFYHCSSCNFTLDMHCILDPPPQYLLDLKTHDHQLTLLPRLISFACNVCGLKGDRSPYICVQCDFFIHQDCVRLPNLIQINRHNHRISRTSILGVVNSICGVCRREVDWACGGYSCKKCPGYVFHSKCATRKKVWNGKELAENNPEEEEDDEDEEDIITFIGIDDITILYFNHKEHYLKLNYDGLLCDDKKLCSACTYPIFRQACYGCTECNFFLHQKCVKLPTKKWHVRHNERLTLVTNENRNFVCQACYRISSGFSYTHQLMNIDVICGSISEPFVHPSHPQHPLYCIPEDEDRICNRCKKGNCYVLRCIEDGCEYVLDFECATLPALVNHRVDDHPLSLCFGEKASDKYWCDICERYQSGDMVLHM